MIQDSEIACLIIFLANLGNKAKDDSGQIQFFKIVEAFHCLLWLTTGITNHNFLYYLSFLKLTLTLLPAKFVDTRCEVDNPMEQTHYIVLEEIIDGAAISPHNHDFKQVKSKFVGELLHHLENVHDFIISEAVCFQR